MPPRMDGRVWPGEKQDNFGTLVAGWVYVLAVSKIKFHGSCHRLTKKHISVINIAAFVVLLLMTAVCAHTCAPASRVGGGGMPAGGWSTRIPFFPARPRA